MISTSVVLLVNIFEAFRDTCLKHYSLDPVHFYMAPRLAWKVCLKKTGVRLELLMDPDMLLMFERGIRGGITRAVHRYASANNKYMGDLYDPIKNPAIFNTSTPAISMVGPYLSHFQLANSNGLTSDPKVPSGPGPLRGPLSPVKLALSLPAKSKVT